MDKSIVFAVLVLVVSVSVVLLFTLLRSVRRIEGHLYGLQDDAGRTALSVPVMKKKPSPWGRFVAFWLYAVVLIGPVTIVILRYAQGEWIDPLRDWLVGLAERLFDAEYFEASLSLAFAGSLSALALVFFHTFRKISRAVREKLVGAEREALETHVLLSGIITGAIASLLVFLIEHSKHSDKAEMVVLGEIALAALAGIIVALFVFVGSIVFSFDRKIGRVSDDLQELEEAAGQVENASLSTTRAAQSAFQTALMSIKVDTSRLSNDLLFRTHFSEPASLYLRALSRWYGEESVDDSANARRAQNAKGRREAIARIFQSYLYEETFDIWHRALVTNPRNYAMFLNHALYGLATSAQAQGLRAHVYVVTPVAYQYAFAWPMTGGARWNSTGTFLMPFLAEYYLFQQEMLGGSLADSISMRRYIVHSEKTQLLRDLPAFKLGPLTADPELVGSLLPLEIDDLKGIFRETSALNEVVHQSCVAMFRPGGASAASIVSSSPSPVFRPILPRSAAAERLCRQVKQGAAAIADEWGRRYRSKRDYIVDQLRAEQIHTGDDVRKREIEQTIDSVNRLTDYLTIPISSDARKIIAFYEERQLASVLLTQELGAHDDDLTADLIDYALWWRMALLAQKLDPGPPSSLSHLFATTLHSPRRDGGRGFHQYAIYSERGGHLINELKTLNEFVVFALSESEELADPEEWVLALTSTIEHPWRSAEISVHTNVRPEEKGGALAGRMLAILRDGVAL